MLISHESAPPSPRGRHCWHLRFVIWGKVVGSTETPWILSSSFSDVASVDFHLLKFRHPVKKSSAGQNGSRWNPRYLPRFLIEKVVGFKPDFWIFWILYVFLEKYLEAKCYHLGKKIIDSSIKKRSPSSWRGWNTWRIIPIGKLFIPMVSFRPLRIGQRSTSKWPFHGL